MTKLFVNNVEVVLPVNGLTSLEQVFRHVEQTHLTENSVIRHVHVDGLPVGSDELQSDLNSSPINIQNRHRIEVHTGTIAEVAKDSIAEALAYLDRMAPVLSSVGASFCATPGPESFENLKELLEGFYWINLLEDRLETAFRIDPESLVVQSKSVHEQKQKFVAIVKQLVGAQESADFILISDLLEYEIAPMIPVWKEVLAKLSERVERAF